MMKLRVLWDSEKSPVAANGFPFAIKVAPAFSFHQSMVKSM